MFGIGMTELMVIFVIGLLVLGPKRLPELARSLGRSLAEFRRASSDLRREFMNVAEDARIEPPSLEPSTAGEAGGGGSGSPPAASAGGGGGPDTASAASATTGDGGKDPKKTPEAGEPSRDG